MDIYRPGLPHQAALLYQQRRSYERLATTQKAKPTRPRSRQTHTLNYDCPTEYGKQSVAGQGLMETINPSAPRCHRLRALFRRPAAPDLLGDDERPGAPCRPVRPFHTRPRAGTSRIRSRRWTGILHGYDQWDLSTSTWARASRHAGRVDHVPYTQWPVDVTEWNGASCVPAYGRWAKTTRTGAIGSRGSRAWRAHAGADRPLSVNKGPSRMLGGGQLSLRDRGGGIAEQRDIWLLFAAAHRRGHGQPLTSISDVNDAWPKWGQTPKLPAGPLPTPSPWSMPTKAPTPGA